MKNGIIAAAFCLLLPLTTIQGEQNRGKVLVVCSSADSLGLADGTVMRTGYFLNELAVPARYLEAKGYEIVVATPKGNIPAMDARSKNVKFFESDAVYKNAVSFTQSDAMTHPATLKDVIAGGLDRFAALYVPGGHAPMSDLMQDRDLGKILGYFHANGIPTAFLCHGPAAALAALPDPPAFRAAMTRKNSSAVKASSSGWIYAGYRMTVFSDAEEIPGEKHGKMPFYVEDALRSAGGHVEAGTMFESHVVRDRELITGQNPASDLALVQELFRAIEEKKNQK